MRKQMKKWDFLIVVFGLMLFAAVFGYCASIVFSNKKPKCITYHNDLNNQTLERNNCTQYFIISTGDTLKVVWKQRWSWSLKK